MSKRLKSEDVKEVESKEAGGDCKYKVDSMCWARHGPLIYLAKVLKTKREKQETHLFVHYNNWNKKWDTWVAASDVLDDIPETLEIAKKLQAEVKKMKENKKRKPAKDSDDEALVKGEKDSGSAKKGKRKSMDAADSSIEPEEEEDSGKSQKVCLKIPGQIKKELIHDWENITKNNRITTLPRPSGTVTTILGDFVKAKTKNNTETAEQYIEMCAGIKVYFDRALPFVLLYNQERTQYKEQLASAGEKQLVASDIYGAEHLSRLFVKFPELLAHTQLSTPELGLLQPKLADFLKWLGKFTSKYFGKQYIPAGDDGENKGKYVPAAGEGGEDGVSS